MASCGAGKLLVDLGIGKQKPQGIGSHTGKENIAFGFCKGAKAVQEYKLQGIGSYRAVKLSDNLYSLRRGTRARVTCKGHVHCKISSSPRGPGQSTIKTRHRSI